ncbi:MAG: hypothetical protein OXC13_18700 [Caldilineaceae bacterium]|nr:hypothetical protein [Caldilineaceae bacterium]
MTTSISKCEKDQLDCILDHLSDPSNRLDECPLVDPLDPASPPIPLIAHYTEVRNVADRNLSLAETIHPASIFVLIITLVVTTLTHTNIQFIQTWVVGTVPVLVFIVAKPLFRTISGSRKGALSIGLHELHYATAFGTRSIGWRDVLNAHRDTVPFQHWKLRQNGKCCIKLDLQDGTTLRLGVPEILICVLTKIMRELIRRHHDGSSKTP